MAASADRKRAALNVPVLLSRDKISSIIRALRRDAGLTLRDLEAKSGVPNSEISKLESGVQDCRLSSFVRIAAALGLPAGAMIDHAIYVDGTFYEMGIRANRQFAEMVKTLKIHDDVALHLAVALIAFASQLLISTKPTMAVADAAFPNDEVCAAFDRFAKTVESGMMTQDRLALLLRLKQNPIDTLTELRLMSLDLFKGFHDAAEAGFSTNPATWNQLVQISGKPLTQCSPHKLQKNSAGIVLTETSESNKPLADVKIPPQWPALKDRLQRATEAIGTKPALAKVLGVDPTQISQWLSPSKQARAPGGDYALRMLKWVELQERQGK